MEDSIKVMILDNHPFTTEAINHFFEKEEVGIKVVGTLTDGRRAIDLINGTNPDVIVMEPYLTNINGIDLAEEIINKYKDKIKIVIFASYACEELIKILYKLGVHAVVLKEEPFKMLINAVKQSYLGNILLSNRKLFNQNHHQLTMTEIEILQLISQEKKNHEIAKQLNMSKRTVEYHITSIFQKLEVDSRVGAIMKGTQKGLIYV